MTSLLMALATGLLATQAAVAPAPSAPRTLPAGADAYVLGPDSMRKPGVPVGVVHGPFVLKSRVYPATWREYWVYVPVQYVAGTAAAVMVFQDGHKYLHPDQEYRVPVVLDNLIAAGSMPVTISVFINPGHNSPQFPADRWRASNRSIEYDTPSGDYARMLLEEVLPEVGARWTLTTDPERRAIVGVSSGGICAFTAAWERPDAFRKVISHIGSFTNIRGGYAYPYLLRKTAKKPLRVYLQDGSNDLDNAHGNWPLANQLMASSLAFAGYDFRFEFGDGGHTHKHGGARLPDALRWLWRDVR